MFSFNGHQKKPLSSMLFPCVLHELILELNISETLPKCDKNISMDYFQMDFSFILSSWDGHTLECLVECINGI